MHLDGIWAEASGAPVGVVMLKGIRIAKYPDGSIALYDCFSSSLIYPYLSERFIKIILDNGWRIGVNKVVVIKSDEILNKIKQEIRLEMLNKHNKRRIKVLKERRDEIIETRRNAHNYIIKRANQ